MRKTIKCQTHRSSACGYAFSSSVLSPGIYIYIYVYCILIVITHGIRCAILRRGGDSGSRSRANSRHSGETRSCATRDGRQWNADLGNGKRTKLLVKTRFERVKNSVKNSFSACRAVRPANNRRGTVIPVRRCLDITKYNRPTTAPGCPATIARAKRLNCAEKRGRRDRARGDRRPVATATIGRENISRLSRRTRADCPGGMFIFYFRFANKMDVSARSRISKKKKNPS